MAQSIKNVMLTGATGNVGTPILKALEEASTFSISVLSRQSSTSTFPSKIRVHKTDYSESDLVTAFKGQDAIISTIGGGGFQHQKKVIDAAIKAGVKRFLPSEFSANTLSPASLDLVPTFKTKKEVLDYLRAKEGEGLSWTGIATGPMFDWCLQVGFLGYDLQSHSAVIWDSGSQPFSVTTAATIGRAVVSTLQHQVETANRYLYVASFTTTQNEILVALEKSTEKSWNVTKTTTDEEVKHGKEMVAKGDFTGFFSLVKASFFGNVKGMRSNFAVDEKVSNQVLELPTENLETVVLAVLAGSYSTEGESIRFRRFRFALTGKQTLSPS